MMDNNLKYQGLTESEISESRRLYGNNVLTPPERESLWRAFLAKFKDPLIVILLIAGMLSIGISCYEYWYLELGLKVFFEPLGIIIAILLATGLAFIFEYKADKEFAILNQVNDDEPVQVIRNGGNVTTVPRKDIVVGDIIILNTGEEIPADAELLESTSLNVDESSLTGEPMASKSVAEAEFDHDATFPTNHVMRGSKVMEGHGIAKVFAVGDSTENGKVFEASQIDDSVKTPLDEQLGRLGKLISVASYAIGAAIIVGRIMVYFNTYGVQDIDWMRFVAYFLQTIMISVTLIVVAVPEGLPMAVTLSLAYSMRRMLKTNNLVRKMHACETMGATTVICTDKTGTLTQNRMQVAEAEFFALDGNRLSDDEISRIIINSIAVNSTAQLDFTNAEAPVAVGNPTEGALLLWLSAQGLDYKEVRLGNRIVCELPFNTERKYMATIADDNRGKRYLLVKGAPEIVYGLCSSCHGDKSKDDIEHILLGYQNRAMRTLGFAYCEITDGTDCFADGKVAFPDLQFLGIVAISDPVRSDVPDAIRECMDAGISIKIVTGDTPATAREIGKQIGLCADSDTEGSIITGPEFGNMSDDELAEKAADIKIIARARPMDKKRLVEILQRRGDVVAVTGDVVAVTGDGTNDAPALKSAHVGLSMGDGTSVAKEASDITIIDNSFASIGRAVMWGRSLYRNIQRFVMFQLTVNVTACLIVLVGAFMGTESPLTVTQMLWVNLIMDTFAAMALSSLPPSASVMDEHPRNRKSFIINRAMWGNIIGEGVLFFVILFGFLYVFQHSDVTSMTDLVHLTLGARNSMTPYELSLLFTIFVMLQFWNMFNARAFSTHKSALHMKGCGEFMFIAAVIFVGQILIVEVGGNFFNVVPLSLSDWAIIILSTSTVLWVGEIIRLFGNKGQLKKKLTFDARFLPYADLTDRTIKLFRHYDKVQIFNYSPRAFCLDHDIPVMP